MYIYIYNCICICIYIYYNIYIYDLTSEVDVAHRVEGSGRPRDDVT